MNQSRGRIARWIEGKGYGFIRPDDGDKDVFVHIRDFGNIGRSPQVGDIINYQLLQDGSGKFRAADASIEGVPRLQSNRPAKSRAKAPERKVTAAIYASVVVVVIFSAVVVGLTFLGKLPVHVVFLYIFASCITMIAYAFDKSAAMNKRWRTKETTLHLLSIAGGWPGALIAQNLFRHKSKKSEFLITFWISVAINCSILAWLSTEEGRAAVNTWSS